MALAKHIYNYDTMVHNAKRLSQVSNILDIPVVATAQKNFKQIDERITEVENRNRSVLIDKTDFSMYEFIKDHLDKNGDRKSVVLYGCESHICVKQTALDLLENHYSVHIVVDAISSMQIQDRNVGLAAMRDAGA